MLETRTHVLCHLPLWSKRSATGRCCRTVLHPPFVEQMGLHAQGDRVQQDFSKTSADGAARLERTRQQDVSRWCSTLRATKGSKSSAGGASTLRAIKGSKSSASRQQIVQHVCWRTGRRSAGGERVTERPTFIS